MHVTVKLCEGLPSMRTEAALEVLVGAFEAGKERFGCRLVHYAIVSNHAHWIVEVEDEKSLARGVKGLKVRMARALNRLWDRTGRVFAERYHARALKTPREVRHALGYVLRNAKRHGIRIAGAIDSFTSGAWFDGWRRLEGVERDELEDAHACPVAPPGTWLLRIGWRRWSLLSP